MKKHTLDILHRHRQHLLEREQAAIQDRMADENNQKARLLQLQSRVADTHAAKLRASSSSDLCALDSAAAYLHGRVTMAQRALGLARQAREEAVARTLQARQERDQVEKLRENARHTRRCEQDAAERLELDDIATARYAMTAEAL